MTFASMCIILHTSDRASFVQKRDVGLFYVFFLLLFFNSLRPGEAFLLGWMEAAPVLM